MDDDRTQAHLVLAPGARIHSYEIVDKIGAGGMGEVYCAEDSKLGRRVALKFLPSECCHDKALRDRFIREARSAAILNHPNIVTIYEVSEIHNRPFIAMELLSGSTLKDLISDNSLETSRAVQIVAQIARALGKAHRNGIVHRDIKPANVMVLEDDTVKLLDFGLAMLESDGQLTRTGTALGTAAYMSPEQALGKTVDARSDIFSLGLLFCELITGTNPFQRENIPATLHAIAYDDLDKSVPELKNDHPSLARIVGKMVERDREKRYESTESLLRDLASEINSGSMLLSRTIVAGQVAEQKEKPQSLAVLCLRNLGTPDDDFLAFGITEDLIVDLTRLGSLRVVPMRSVLRFKESDEDIADIAGKLKTDLILEGSIHKCADTIRVTAYLIDVAAGDNLWADRWQEPIDELPKVKRLLAEAISEALNLDTGEQESGQIGKPVAEKASAYENYLRGKYVFTQRSTKADLQEALDLYNLALEEEPDLLAARAGVAEILIEQIEYDEASSMLDSSLNIATERNQAADQIVLLHLKARLKLLQSRWNEAWKLADKAIELSRGVNDLASEAEGLAIMIDLLSRRAKFDDALRLCERVLEINSELDDKQKVAEALKNMGSVYLRKGEYDQARSFYEEALDIAEKQENSSLQADCTGNIGLTYQHTGDFGRALIFYEKALEVHSRIDDQAKVALWLNNIATVYESRGEFRFALETLEKALEIHKLRSDSAKYALILGNIAEMRYILGEYEMALENAREANELATEHEFPLVIVTSLDVMGHILFHRGRHEEGIDHLTQSLETARDSGLRHYEAFAHLRLAEFYYLLEDSQQCHRNSQAAMSIGKELSHTEIQIVAAGFSAALMIRDGLFNTGVRSLRDAHNSAQNQCSGRVSVVLERLLGEALAKHAKEQSQRDEGLNHLWQAIRMAEEFEIAHETKLLKDLIASLD